MNRASAETQKEIAEEEGLWPVLNWAKQLLDDVIERELSAPHLEFAWGQDQQIDPSQQAVILSTYVKSGVLTINEARAQLGMAPLSEPAANTAQTLTANGYVGIGAGADAANQLARAPVIPQAHPSTGALTRAAQDEDLERAAHLSRTNPLVLSDRRNPSSLTVSLSNREGRSSLDKYSPDQARVPAGHSDGGQWTSGAGGSTSTQTSPHLITGRSVASDAPPQRPMSVGTRSLLDDGVYRPEEDGLSLDTVAASNNPQQRFFVDLRAQVQYGGHGWPIHVARTDEELIGELTRRTARNWFFSIGAPAFGSFDSIETANSLVMDTLATRPDLVELVATGQSNEKWINVRFGFPTGREAYRSDPDSSISVRPTYEVGVLIRHDSRAPNGWYVETAYPRNERWGPRWKVD